MSAWVYGWKNNSNKFKNLGTIVTLNTGELAETQPDYFTIKTEFSPRTDRIVGEYVLGTAVAQLDLGSANQFGGYTYTLDICFEKLEDGKKLYNAIRAGQIWPVVSYQERQVATPSLHVKGLLYQAWQIIKRDVAARYYRIKNSLPPLPEDMVD